MKSIILFLIIGLAHVQSVVAQDDQSVVGANEYLTSQTENTDKDVTEINTLDFLTQTKTAADGLQEIITALGVATSVAQGAPKTSDKGEEENIADSFSQFNAALIALSRDLISKKTYFKTALREPTIHDDLQSIRNGLLTYFSKVGPIITDQGIRDDTAQSVQTAFSALGTAQTEFKS